MDLTELQTNRFLKKDPSQMDQTKDAVYAAVNPVLPIGDTQQGKFGQPNTSTQDGGAPNILTGTVIVSCFIQTSALPSRIELQGNDITFFDDTIEQNGKVIGDTSRLIFTHASGKSGSTITAGFILEKRASVFNSYDNVLSWYSPTPPAGAHDYMFFGRNAYSADQERNISSIHFAVDGETGFIPETGNPPLDGVFEVEYSEDNVFKARVIYSGKSTSLVPGGPFTGYSSLIIGGEGGIVGLGYTPVAGGLAALLYLTDEITVNLGGPLIPDTANAYDIGSSSKPIRNIYADSIVLPGGITWTKGIGSPETVVTAPIGSLYSNTSGGASTTLYVKTSGSGNTGWTAK